MTTRRTFIKKTTLAAVAATMPSVYSCNIKSKDTIPKISLAQWSLNKAFFDGSLDVKNFASISKNNFGISAIEYVNQFYTANATNEKFWSDMTKRATNEGVRSLIMMVDEKEKLGSLDNNKRKTAVEDHYKWVNAAKILGCHSIRVNAFGNGSREELKTSLVDGLGRLTEYAAKENINVILENHGLHTSDATYMTGIIKQVNNPFLGTLPDFGNWCTSAEWGGTKEHQNCTNIYNPAKGLVEFLPYAKGVSAKSYEFNNEGFDTVIDYSKLLKLIKESDFNGYIGIEYEGEGLSPSDGIKATKTLIEKIWATLD